MGDGNGWVQKLSVAVVVILACFGAVWFAFERMSEVNARLSAQDQQIAAIERAQDEHNSRLIDFFNRVLTECVECGKKE